MTQYVKILLFANIIVFFLQQTVQWLTRALVFVPQLIVLRPWTIVTYMFLHGGLMHLLFNMLALYFFGPQVEERLGSRRFLILYFLSGISGALLSFLFSPGAPILGASAAVFGVMLAFAYFWPDAPIHIWGIIPVPARILVIITTVFALWSGISGAGSGIAHFAHLGGYVGAFLYLRWIERGRREFRKRATGGGGGGGGSGGRIVERPRITKRPAIDMSTVHEVNRDEVNRLLDKISAQGIDSLTPQERLFLSNFAPPDDRKPPVS